MIWTNDPNRLMLVAASAAAYGLVCLLPYLRARRKRLAAVRSKAEAEAATSPGWTVAYASQTGNAEELASQTVATLRLAGIPAQLSELSDLHAEDLQRAERVLNALPCDVLVVRPESFEAHVEHEPRGMRVVAPPATPLVS